MLVFGILSLVLLLATATAVSDEITSLPGAPAVSFKQYSGHITVNKTAGRSLFYWFVESQNDPDNDPLVLWLNGGPGCSSLAGLLTENGPFWVNQDGRTLRANPHSWNKVANVVYLESPAGVGFSYSNTSSDYVVGDKRTAEDAYIFIQNFLAQYPKFRKSQFWITGESYAGHYVPNLAQVIVHKNAEGANPIINLVGVQIGNPWTVPAVDNEGSVDFWHSHAYISDETYIRMKAHCDWANIGPLKGDAADCNAAIREARQNMAMVNIYNIYADVCLDDSVNGPSNQAEMLVERLAASSKTTPFAPRKSLAAAPRPRFSASSAGSKNDIFPDPDPCVDAHLTQYLNRADVQEAIHARGSIKYSWRECSNIIDYSDKDLFTPMLDVYADLFRNAASLKILIYSGDIDAIVSVTGTRNWVGNLGLPIKEKWRPWMDAEKQVGGYTIKYSGLTFASVRGSGHMVPWAQPMRSFDLFSRFLKDQAL